MKKRLYNSILLPVLVAILLIAGCEPADFNYSKEVVFTAATGYDNLPGTKTVYTGTDVTVDGKPYELIDWVAGDQIRVMAHNVKTAANNPSAEYAVQSANINQHSGRNSTATVAKVGDGLSWSSTTATSDTFYAIYPSPTKNANASISVGTSNATIGGTIPATQNYTTHTNASAPDMDNAYMWAAKTASAGSTINLEFQPAFTAFQITINNNTGKGLKINSLKLTSSSMAINGSFTGTISASANPSFGGFPTASSTNKEISVTGLPSSAIADGSSASVTLFALPRDLQNMSIKMNVTSDGQTVDKTLDLKKDGSFMTFDKCKKYRINVGAPTVDEPWIYVIEPEPISTITTYGHVAMTAPDFTVKSYKYKASDPTNKVAVPWQLEFSANGTSGWSTTPDARLSLTSTSGVGGATGETVTPSIARTHYDSEKETTGHDSEASAIAELRNRTEVGSSSSPFDLSTHPFYGNINSTISRETANCYVITRAGHYRIPIVYGNAIKNGTTNNHAYQGLKAYDTGNNDNDHYMRTFLRHDDGKIVDPWISGNGITVTSAVVVWQDVDGAANQILLDSDLAINGDYLDFEIKKDNIRPGNIVVAVRNASDVIVWSWHLWVTEKDLSPVSVTDLNSVTHQMLPYNLGWTDAKTANTTHWNDWTFYVHVKQTETGGVTGTAFAIEQIGESTYVAPNVGSNTFYQWGRKDPMLPAASSVRNKTYYSAADFVLTTDNTHIIHETPPATSEKVTVGHSIQNPHIQYHKEVSATGGNGKRIYLGGAGDVFIGNLWDADLIPYTNTSIGTPDPFDNRLPVKTVYDPCPPGFCVPYGFFFGAFTRNQSDWVTTAPAGATLITGEGWRFNNNDHHFFPFTGARGGNGVQGIFDVTSLGYYWTTAPDSRNDSDWRACSKFLYLSETTLRARNDQDKAACYAIRAVHEQ
ncbi:MAG: fimbrillin family protein [Bacteroidales bacterium]|nr:fimbrillin family protein [Bacteroidales bacterium]